MKRPGLAIVVFVVALSMWPAGSAFAHGFHHHWNAPGYARWGHRMGGGRWHRRFRPRGWRNARRNWAYGNSAGPWYGGGDDDDGGYGYRALPFRGDDDGGYGRGGFLGGSFDRDGDDD